MNTAITAIGIATPPFKRSQVDTVELIIAGLNVKPAQKRLLKSVYKATGIEQRHSVLADYCRQPGEFTFFPNHPENPFPTTAARMQVYKENACNLALAAIQQCFDTDPAAKDNITHLITISCTGMYAPGIDIEIVQQLNLPTHIKRTAINFMGCYGAFNGIKIADAICKADSSAKVLMVCVELCTIHFQNNLSIDNVISNSIFADGAAAIIIEKKPDEKKKCFSLESFYCDLLPQTSQEMAWRIADFGFDIVLSTYVPDVIQAGIAAFTQKLLQQSEMQNSQIDLFAIHPGGLKILQACELSLNMSKEDNRYSYEVLRQYGNMSSPTVLFVLKKIWDDLTLQDKDKKIFSCAFGPGLTMESMILKVA